MSFPSGNDSPAALRARRTPTFTDTDVHRYAHFITGHPNAEPQPVHLAAARAVLGGVDRDNRLLPAQAATYEPVYLVWSNTAQAWWGPDGHRYTPDVWAAGRYDEDEARRACRMRTWRSGAIPPEVAVLAPEHCRPALTLDQIRKVPAEMRERISLATAAAMIGRR